MSEKNRDLIWLFMFLVVSISILAVLMWGLGGGYMSGMMDMMEYGWGSMVLVPIVFLVLITLGAYYLITGSSRIDGSSRDRSAVEILRERYAKGEVTRAQFLKVKKELES